MERRTYGLLLLEAQRELDLQNEEIIQPEEYVDMCNDVIQKAEGIIHDLHEDYFRTSAKLTNPNSIAPILPGFVADYPVGVVDGVNRIFTLPSTPSDPASLLFFVDGQLNADLVLAGVTVTLDVAPSIGQAVYFQYQTAAALPATGNGLMTSISKYPLPSNIYANKIRELVFNDTDLIYEITPFSPRRKQWEVAYKNQYFTDDNRIFQYQLTNDLVYDPTNPNTTSVQIEFIPVPKITGDFVTVHFLREAQKIPYTNNTSTQIDIPEFYDYIKYEFMARCAFKSINPKYETLVGWANDARTRMVQTLSTRKEDGSKRCDADFSFYEGHA